MATDSPAAAPLRRGASDPEEEPLCAPTPTPAGGPRTRSFPLVYFQRLSRLPQLGPPFFLYITGNDIEAEEIELRKKLKLTDGILRPEAKIRTDNLRINK